MATVTGLTAARMLEIEAASVVDGDVVADNLILTKHDGSQIDAGNVRGTRWGTTGIWLYGDLSNVLVDYADGKPPQIGDIILSGNGLGPGSLGRVTAVIDASHASLVDTGINIRGQAGTPVNYASPVFTGVVKLPTVAYTPPAGASGGPLQRFDNVCAFSSDTGYPVGAIVLRAPYGFSGQMSLYDLVGYSYDGGTGVWGARISFYSNGTGPAYANPVIQYTGKFQPQIRLAREISSGNIVFILGDVATTWAYPKIQIISAFLGLNAVPDTYMNGWQSSLVTSLAAYDTLTTPNNMSFSAVMPAPVSITATGTVTPNSTVETRCAVTGNYVFTAIAGHRYKACLDNACIVGSVAGDQYAVRIRNGGMSTPTAVSPLISSSRVVSTPAGVALPVGSSATFVPGAGVQTLSVFLVRAAGTGTTYLWSNECARQFYVMDLGA